MHRKGEEVFSIILLPGSVGEYLFQFLEITAAPHQLQTDSGGVNRLIQLVRFLYDGVLILLTNRKLLRGELLVPDDLVAVMRMNTHIERLNDFLIDRDHFVEIQNRDELLSIINLGEILVVIHVLVLGLRRTQRHAVLLVIADHDDTDERTRTLVDLRGHGHDVIIDTRQIPYVFDIYPVELQTWLLHTIPFDEKGCDKATAFMGSTYGRTHRFYRCHSQ